ncbi:MAG: SemiSWEET transporter [Alphaproteobacteria bacterium]|nr:SemiSWEET transporter [Alphaproteobacteria bacterium]
MLPIVEYLGILAGTLTTISFLPQVLKIWKEQDVSSISILMYTLFCFGVFFWIIYGMILNSLSLILANSITLFLAMCVLFLKISIERKQ